MFVIKSIQQQQYYILNSIFVPKDALLKYYASRSHLALWRAKLMRGKLRGCDAKCYQL